MLCEQVAGLHNDVAAETTENPVNVVKRELNDAMKVARLVTTSLFITVRVAERENLKNLFFGVPAHRDVIVVEIGRLRRTI